MKKIALVCITLLSLGTLCASWTQSGSTYTRTIGDYVLTYQNDTSFDPQTLSARLVAENSLASITWGSNREPFTWLHPTEFFYKQNDMMWYFDLATNQWLTQDGKNGWEITNGGNSTFWTHVEKRSVWIRLLPFILPVLGAGLSAYEWHQFLFPATTKTTPSQSDYFPIIPVPSITWHYDKLNTAFFNQTLSTSWGYSWDQATRRMLLTSLISFSNPETWAYDPITEAYSLISPDLGRNDWREVSTNGCYIKWVEAQSKETFVYIPSDRVDIHGAGEPYGMWQNTNTHTKWYFNNTLKQWETYDGSLSKHFPPLVPPLLAMQIETIESFTSFPYFFDGQGTSIGLSVSGTSLRLTDEDCTLNFIKKTCTLPSGVKIGNKFSSEDSTFASDYYMYAFQTTEGERWTTSLTGPGTLDATNASVDIADTDIISQTSLHDWYRKEAPSQVWSYFLTANLWKNQALNMAFVFDHPTFTWIHQGGTAVWKYLQNDSFVWVWKNQTTDEEWQYVKNGSIHEWHNLNDSTIWTPSGLNWINTVDSSVWTYNSATHRWFTTGNPVGLDLFPLIPCNYAGYKEVCRYLTFFGQTVTAVFEGTTLTSNLLDLINDQATRLAAIPGCFVSEDPSQQGLAKREGVIPTYNYTLPYETIMQNRIRTIFEDFSYFYMDSFFASSSDLLIVPASGVNTFAWSPSAMSFFEPGKGAGRFSVSTATNKFRVGFDTDIYQDGNALYTFEIGPTLTNADIKEISIYQYDRTTSTQTLLHHEILSDYPVAEFSYYTGGAFLIFWFTLDNGHFVLGKNDSLVVTEGNKKVIFDYTFTQSDIQNISYFSFAQYPGQTNSFSQVTPFPLNYLQNIFTIPDLGVQMRDVLYMSEQEEIWLRAKNRLLSMAVSTPTTQEKLSIAQEVLTTINGDGNTRSALAEIAIVESTGKLAGISYYQISQNSQEYLDYIYNSLTGANTIVTRYQTYTESLQSLEDAFGELLVADASTLTHAQRVTLITNTKAAISSFINTISSDISDTIELATTLNNINGNQDLAAFTAFFQEELAILEELSNALTLVDPVALIRFSSQDTLYTTDPISAQLNMKQSASEQEQSRLTTIDMLSQAVAGSNCSLFAALNAGTIILCLNNKFDSIRETLETYLQAQGYTNYHVPPAPLSPLTNLTTAYNTIKTILDTVVPSLTLNGSTLSKTPSGIQKRTQETSATAYIEQLVSGVNAATLLNQQKAALSGTPEYLANNVLKTANGEKTAATIREVLSSEDDKTAAYSRIYVKDALVALGNGNYTRDSGNALSLLGAAEITPEGNAVITLNSDLTISGPNFLKPSAQFGASPEASARCIPAVAPAQEEVHEIVFYSPVERIITITSGTDLDLTGFGKGTAAHGQRIVFAGKVKLVFEPNTRLRLPYTSPAEFNDYSLTIAFKDDAQLVFQGIQNYDIDTFTDAVYGPDQVRSKILGCGTLAFSGHAQTRIMDSALVSVEADYVSNITNIHIELNDNSSWLIGEKEIPGGGFQVGNIQEGGSNVLDPSNYPNTTDNPLMGDTENPFDPHPTHIDFTLNLQGTNAQFYIGKKAFFGLAVGTINKEGVINGTETSAPWTVHSLFDVGNITLNFIKGTFWHQNCVTGDDESASLVAFGELITRALYKINIDKGNLILIKGGGNVLFLRSGVIDPLELSITDTIIPLAGGPDDNGKFSILAPAPLIMLRQVPDAINPQIKRYGRAIIDNNPNQYRFSGPVDEAFLAMTFQQLSANGKYVVSYLLNGGNNIIFINNTGTIVNTTVSKRSVKDQGNRKVTTQNLSSQGLLRSVNYSGNSRNFIRPRG